MAEPVPLAQVIVLPFQVLNAEPQVKPLVMPTILHEIQAAGFAPLSGERVDSFLRLHRVRNTSWLDQQEALRLCQEMSTPWILLGTIDVYAEKDPVQVGFSARFINGLSGRIIWTNSGYATGEDYVKILGVGRITSAESLAKLVLQDFFKTLREVWLLYPEQISSYIDKEGTPRKPSFMVLPFENLTSNPAAHRIVNNLFLNALIHRGFPLLDPGVVNEQLLANAHLAEGEIDRQTLDSLTEIFPVDYCLTGAVSLCEMTTLASDLDIPVVGLDVRVLEAATGNIIWARHLEHSGSDYALVFHLGEVRAEPELLKKSVEELTASLEKFLISGKGSVRSGKL